MNIFKKTVAQLWGQSGKTNTVSVHHFRLDSAALAHSMAYDVYLPPGYDPAVQKDYPLVLFNDGQDLPRMQMVQILEKTSKGTKIPAFITVGVHCTERRIREYGTVQQPDYKGRGDLAPQYAQFILQEFLPHLREQFRISAQPKDLAFAGFSLGGLSALDIAWAHPEVFSAVGVFSGSLWWRSKEVRPEDPDADRIMHEIMQKATDFDQKQRFWFQCGTLDEEDDRNNNGVIDAIDDTLDLIRALRDKGIPEQNIRYLEVKNGRHEPGTWAEAMPDFLGWIGAKK